MEISHKGKRMCSQCFDYEGKCNHKGVYTFQVDLGIIDIIKELNLKGYKTIGCCEGEIYLNEMKKKPNYIVYYKTFSGGVGFEKDYGFNIPEDSVLKLTKMNKNKDIVWLGCNMSNIEDVDNIKEIFIKELKNFADNLKDLS